MVGIKKVKKLKIRKNKQFHIKNNAFHKRAIRERIQNVNMT